MPCLLALDQGTTSSRAIVFNAELGVVATAQQEFRQIYPHPGWVEHDPNEIWRTQLAVAEEALRQANITAADVAAIGITNQRETTVLWDRVSGEPVHNAIVWQDRRTADLCDRMRADGHEPAIRRHSGLLLDPYFSASKIRWLLDHCGAASQAAAEGRLAFGTIDSWLIFKLTRHRVHLTDASNASRTQLYDLATGAWSEELLRLWGIPNVILPRLVDSSGICATTDLIGGRELPIAGIAGDQQAALFGQCCFTPGMAKCTYGTGCFILVNTATVPVPSAHRLLTTVAWSIDGIREFALEGSVFMGGATIQWLRDGLGLVPRAADIEQLAAEVSDTGGVVLVPAFTGLGAPHWDPQARGALLGVTRGTTRAHIARAALEGIAMQVTDVFDAIRQDLPVPLRELRVDGGAAANDLLLQIQADLMQLALSRPAVAESTALGAAGLAGLAVGIWPNRDALARTWREHRRFTPAAGTEATRCQRTRWRQAVACVRNFAHADDSKPA